MITISRHTLIAGLLLICITPATPLSAAEPSFFLRDFNKNRLIISTTDRGCILFDVYVAETPQQRTQGLMNIESMDRYEGMLFLYPEDTNISMWMKNTLIPLDMLFINNSGGISQIHSNAVPMSEAIIESGSAVRAVLELNGGSADYFYIKVGDRIMYPVR
ncbi:MAG: DUF192 domain-containing protein [Gammaproteobacteria bacterium]